MSQMSVHKGTISEVHNGGRSLGHTCQNEMKILNFVLPNNLKNAVEFFTYEMSEEYVIIDNKLYKISKDIELDKKIIKEAWREKNGNISYVLSYYNGNCSFFEALEEAVHQMKEEKREEKVSDILKQYREKIQKLEIENKLLMLQVKNKKEKSLNEEL